MKNVFSVLRSLLLPCFLFAGFATSFAQANLELVSQLPYDTIINNCWGYVHPDGTEYAMVGTSTGLSIVSLADPQNPEELHRISEPYALWRDIFTYGNFAYAVADQSVSKKGVLILDLTPLPAAPVVDTWRPFVPEFGDSLNRCHNLSITEGGLLLLSGCNLNNGGVLLADISMDPWQPQYVGPAEAEYSHDSHVRGDTLYSSNILAGTFSVIDIGDPANPQLLATQITPGEFTHNAWTSDDGNYLFTTDEKPNEPVAAYDISELDNIRELDQYRPYESLGTGVLPHNVQVIDDYLIVSYYVDGCIMLDGARPHNLIEVARYDTYPGQETGFRGNWGAYMWYPSGLIIASDITEGLFVFNPTYERACYLEGKVTDAQNGANLSGATVQIVADQPNETTTGLLGDYATGLARAGTYEVTVSRTGYFEQSLPGIQLDNGVLTELNVALEPLPEYSVSGQVVDQETAEPVPFAKIALVTEELEYQAEADAEGNFTLENVYLGEYTLIAGAWGYRIAVSEEFSITEDRAIDIFLLPGYEDIFAFDLGWEVSGDAATGQWERGRPLETLTGAGRISNPGTDSPADPGYSCYVTGNGGGATSDDDVDDGQTILTSPPVDLSGYLQPELQLDLWFFNAWAATEPNDNLLIEVIRDGSNLTSLLWFDSKNEWRQNIRLPLSGFSKTNAPLRIRITTGDDTEREHLLEAAIDNFRIVETAPFSEYSINRDLFRLEALPNPFSETLEVYYEITDNSLVPGDVVLEVYDAAGRLVETTAITSLSGMVSLNATTWPAGTYYLSLLANGRRSPAQQVIRIGP